MDVRNSPILLSSTPSRFQVVSEAHVEFECKKVVGFVVEPNHSNVEIAAYVVEIL